MMTMLMTRLILANIMKPFKAFYQNQKKKLKVGLKKIPWKEKEKQDKQVRNRKKRKQLL